MGSLTWKGSFNSWGIVKYTKQSVASSTSEDFPASKDFNKSVPAPDLNAGKTANLSALTLHIQNGVTAAIQEKEIAILRKDRGLRELTALESGKKCSELPKGTFFFVFAHVVRSTEFNSVQNQLLEEDVERFRRSNAYVEIHNTLKEGFHVIGFLSEADAARISQLSGQEVHNTALSPYPWGQLTSLVSVTIERIQTSTARNVQPSKDESYVLLDLRIK